MRVCPALSARGHALPGGTAALERLSRGGPSSGVSLCAVFMRRELLKVEKLRVQFGAFPALRDVSFDLMPGETVGLVGESGSGKSTLARAILRLIPITSGQVFFQGENILSLGAAALRHCRRDLQIVFQDPLASLNPRMS